MSRPGDDSSQDWPAWATEPVTVLPPDDGWAAAGAAEVEQVRVLLAPWQVAAVEHVGSTSVPGLAAKPILDVMAGLNDLTRAAQIAAALAPHDWHYVPPELDGREHRRFFVRVRDGHRYAHLHLMDPAGQRWHDQLAFRDALRGDPALVAEYAALKRNLAAQLADDREAYSAAKTTFVRRVLADGEAERDR